MIDLARNSLGRLYVYCKNQNWAGYDPYDALNSPHFKHLSNKWARIVITQIFRHLPLDLRYFFKIEKSSNPKALALFIRSLIKLSSIVDSGNYKDELNKISDRLLDLKSTEPSNSGMISWGYNFAWQSRAFYCEPYSPNIQSTIMCAHAFYELSTCKLFTKETSQRFKDVCIMANRYILANLLMYEDEEIAVLAYILNDNTIIINVQAQAAWSLLRAYLFTGEKRFLDISLKLLRFVERKQQRDGSWLYGEAVCQGFIDNFHTGFILEALYECKAVNNSSVPKETIERGYKFYINHFFNKKIIVKYFYNSNYPVDSHAIAQSVITISKLIKYDDQSEFLLNKIINWTLINFQSKKGYFYYQKWPYFKNRISYMRWTQAWMFYALASFLEIKKREKLCVE